MKTLRTLLVIAIAVVGFNVKSFAQVEATATTSGTVVTAIAIENNAPLDFGSFAVNATGGTVTLTAEETPTRGKTAGVTLQAGGTVSTAKFTVTGYEDANYSIDKPDEVTLSDGSGHSMTVNLAYSTITGTLTGGTEVFYVGGTLNASGNQTPGTYSNDADLTITVDYE